MRSWGNAPGYHVRRTIGGQLFHGGFLIEPEAIVNRDNAPTRSIFGRGAELKLLSRAVTDVGRGHSRTIEVIGEPGIGKTRLLLELRRDTAASRMTVLTGRGGEPGREVPFSLFTEAVDDYLAGLAQAERARLLADPLLAPAFEHLACVAPGSPERAACAEDVERRRLFNSVRELLTRIAGGHGLALLLDDVHWADPDSADLLGHLVRHPPAGPVLLAVAHRPKQAVARLAATLSSAARYGLLQVLHLGPLTPTAADELLEALTPAVGQAGRAALYRASGGNPFYLEVLADARRGGRPAEAEGPCPRLTAMLHAELTALRPQTLAAAQAAAVLGEPFDVCLVAEVAGLGTAEVFAAMDELACRDLVRQLGSSSRFVFRHPVVRHVTYRAIGAGGRIAAHTRAVEALRARGGSAVAMAPHVERTAGVGDTDATRVLADAAGDALDRDPAVAAQWLQTALRLLPDPPEFRLRRRELLLRLAEAHARGGQLVESEAALVRAIEMVDEDDRDTRTRLVAQRAGITRLLGRHAQTVSCVDDELSGGQRADSADAVALRLERTVNAVLAGTGACRVEPEPVWAEQAVSAALRLGDRGLHVSALAAAALAEVVAGGFDAAAELVAQAGGRVDRLADVDVAVHLDGVVWLSWCEVHLGESTAAVRHLEHALVLARSSGRSVDTTRLLVVLAAAQLDLGAVPASAEAAEAAVEAGIGLPGTELRTMTLYAHCRALAHRGATSAAVEAGLAATRAAEPGRGLWWSLAWLALAEARLLHGDPQGAVTAVRAVVGDGGLAAVPPIARAEVAELVVRAELALGRPEAAWGWAERLDPAEPHRAGFAALARAQVLTGSDPTAAALHGAQAESAFTAAGRRLLAGRARLVTASALLAAGKQAKAAAELFRAEQLLRECGAAALVERAVAEQRRLAKATQAPPEPRAGLATLTARERQVADLVTSGRTNRQIAQRLGVSDKTVEAHLARVFAKLGVGSRAAVASVVARSRTAIGLLSEGA
ncbi:helix-turn-helix transcriptional regulator [Actinokineospora spheciospongiae]|uniref:helix-turn-helix transcriptional regulator n=1 Tax=Actinokineospora spheciospongiae TaxID=909613 RepID=UPI000D718602|nr:LuxR family transcriptional regulator [Actinokineospora spheciospongiae]PWW66632.1 regulatory LuxR family protein [Actinokineospora spheciospongiae]